MNQIPNIEETHNFEVEELKEFYSTEGIPDEMKQSISFMRQWLNEDRKATPMVTSKNLWHWIEPTYRHQLQKVQEEEKERIVAIINDIDAPEGAWREALTGFKKVLVSVIDHSELDQDKK